MTDAQEVPAREAMDYDVVVVGGGPAGLGAAIRLKQLAAAAGAEVSVAVLEKGSEVGAHILSGAVIDPKGLNAEGKVVFGSTVELEDEDSGDRVTYQIVGEDEADLKLGLINISSPIARAMIGKESGDVAVVQAPGGQRRYEIIQVSYL